MKKEKIVIAFELYRKNELVGYEIHGIDPDIGHIRIYHKKAEDTQYKFGFPVTMGDKYYIIHDDKKIVVNNIILGE